MELTNQTTFNPETKELGVKGVHTKLTPIESKLLSFLIENKDEICNTKEIIKKVWRVDYNKFTDNSMRVYIRKLRTLLKNDPFIFIKNQYKEGYGLLIIKD